MNIEDIKKIARLKTSVAREVAIEDLLTQHEQEIMEDTEDKILASINSFLAEKGITDTDGTPLTFSPERF